MTCFIFGLRVLLLLGWLLAGPANAQAPPEPALEWVRNARYQVKYQVPTDWRVELNAHDSAAVVLHVDPSNQILMVVTKLRHGARRQSPDQALDELLMKFGVRGNKRYRTNYSGIGFVETTGTGFLNGRELRYDALAANHRGHVLLVYLYAPSEVFDAHNALLTRVVHSFAPYRERRPQQVVTGRGPGLRRLAARQTGGE